MSRYLFRDFGYLMSQNGTGSKLLVMSCHKLVLLPSSRIRNVTEWYIIPSSRLCHVTVLISSFWLCHVTNRHLFQAFRYVMSNTFALTNAMSQNGTLSPLLSCVMSQNSTYSKLSVVLCQDHKKVLVPGFRMCHVTKLYLFKISVVSCHKTVLRLLQAIGCGVSQKVTCSKVRLCHITRRYFFQALGYISLKGSLFEQKFLVAFYRMVQNAKLSVACHRIVS